MPVSFLEDDTVDFPDELDTSFFARVSNTHTPVLLHIHAQIPHTLTQFLLFLFTSFPPPPSPLLSTPLVSSSSSSSSMQDGLRRGDEELSTYADDVFDSPSEAAIKEEESNTAADESDLTGGALDKNELERSHLML